MESIINFMGGSVYVEIRGAFPERFLNLCAKNGTEFWNMSNPEPFVYCVEMSAKSFLNIRKIAKKSACRVRIIKRHGLPFFAKRFKKRYALIFGAALFFAAAWVCTSFVWVINIDAENGTDIPRLRALLEREGVKPGAYCASVNPEDVKNNILIDMPELSYVYVNISGSHADVSARLRKEAPETKGKEPPCDIIAEKSGVIYDITVKTGDAQVARGDVVCEGDILVSGYMTGRAGTTLITHADADIYARVWRTETAEIRKKQSRKRYTGREKTRYALNFFGNRINFYFNSRNLYTKCDKIIEKVYLAVTDNIKLPVFLETATYREYETEDVIADKSTLSKELYGGVSRRTKPGEGASLVSQKAEESEEENFYKLRQTSEYIERIGTEREILRG